MELCIVTLEVFAKTWRLTLVLGMFAYLVLVHVLRYQRAKSLEKKHAPAGRESFRNMTADDAQAILKTLAELEFPSFYGVSMVMALFRVGRTRKYLCSSLLTDPNTSDIRYTEYILSPSSDGSTQKCRNRIKARR